MQQLGFTDCSQNGPPLKNSNVYNLFDKNKKAKIFETNNMKTHNLIYIKYFGVENFTGVAIRGKNYKVVCFGNI